MVIFACGMSYLALVWTLVVIGLQGPSLAATVGGTKDLPWVQNSGTLVSVVIAPPLSRISDAVGRKWIVVVGIRKRITCFQHLYKSCAPSPTDLYTRRRLGKLPRWSLYFDEHGVSSFVRLCNQRNANFSTQAIAGGTFCGLLVGMQGPYSAIVSEVTPRRYRALAQGLLNM